MPRVLPLSLYVPLSPTSTLVVFWDKSTQASTQSLFKASFPPHYPDEHVSVYGLTHSPSMLIIDEWIPFFGEQVG